jgi:KOW motif
MANTAVNTIKSAAVKVQTAKSAAKTPGVTTISGVGGVGVATTPKRPNSSRKPSIVTSHHTGPTTFGEGKETEHTANRYLSQTSRQKLIGAYYKPKAAGGMNDYYAHNAKSTAPKKPVKEETQLDEIHRPGNLVQITKGPHAGKIGRVGEVHRKLGGGKDYVIDYSQHHQHIKDDHGYLSSVRLPVTHFKKHGEATLGEEAPSMSIANGSVAGVAPVDATVDFAAQKAKKIRRLAMAQHTKVVKEE